MNIHEFKIVEMFNNSKGKTSLALVGGALGMLTGSFIGVYGAVTGHEGLVTQGLGYFGAGATLLGIRRFTPDKEPDVTGIADVTKVTNTVTDTTEIITPKQV